MFIAWWVAVCKKNISGDSSNLKLAQLAGLLSTIKWEFSMA